MDCSHLDFWLVHLLQNYLTTNRFYLCLLWNPWDQYQYYFAQASFLFHLLESCACYPLWVVILLLYFCVNCLHPYSKFVPCQTKMVINQAFKHHCFLEVLRVPRWRLDFFASLGSPTDWFELHYLRTRCHPPSGRRVLARSSKRTFPRLFCGLLFACCSNIRFRNSFYFRILQSAGGHRSFDSSPSLAASCDLLLSRSLYSEFADEM